ncbi:MAG: EscU/YscU/HrcU family type III secretion system export apparatus switch protein [Acidihalobacter sp.]|jgi:flagellar biosynthesis protein|uniref:EscU/YscU/HrcU family type III secretion system export apparatus switch protein n=1 Tax=Acidihalobacter sp. TaxID=1872108 RepID=UPI00307F8145
MSRSSPPGTKDPTERRLLAVALHYSGEGAPRVTAKGYGVIGEQILERARTHDVPIRQDAELSGLLARVPLGDEIPETLYLAVAEVLAFAYRLSGGGPEALNSDEETVDNGND